MTPPGADTKDPIGGLSPRVPVALLPIRLVTRFVRKAPKARPHALRIRLLPDPIMVDSHRDALTRFEAELGRAYWSTCFATRADEVELAAAQSALVDALGRPRARWVARATRPKNAARASSGAKPQFPEITIDDTPDPAVVRLLPDRWSAQVRTGNEFSTVYSSEPVNRTAPVVASPQLTDVPEGGVRAFLGSQGLDWRYDFDAALAAGMAFEIPVVGESRLRGFSELIVFGVLEGDQSGPVEQLLARHRYGDGLTLLPAGTPTNNTDLDSVPLPDPAAPEFDPVPVRSPQAPPKLGGPELFTEVNDRAAAGALGLATSEAFDGAPIADRADGAWSAAMNQALWPGLSTMVFSELLGSQTAVLDPDDWAWLREWFADYVRGGPHLPTLAVGDVPYGLLPATVLPSALSTPDPGDPEAMLASQVAQWEQAWTGSEAPAISPLTEGTVTRADQTVEVASILGAVPNPTALRLRGAPLERAAISGDFRAAGQELAAMVAALPAPYGAGHQTRFQEHLDRVAGDVSAGSQHSSLQTFAFWVRNDEGTFSSWTPNPATQILDHIEQIMYPQLDEHESRTRSRFMTPQLGTGKLPDAQDPDLWYVDYGDLDPDAPTLSMIGHREELAGRMRARLEMAQAKAKGRSVRIDHDAERALLYVLLDQSIDSVAKGSERLLVGALETLCDIAAREDGAELLERIASETIGLFSHRADAWRTSLAARRLAELRADRPRGLQVGCFGFVADLVPDDGSPDTQGYVHAPSLDHAATAAILRSAWQGLGGRAADAPFAVDLSSDRVRRATWLLDGMRNGYELGDLLGQRLERRMHDAGLDRYIDDVRVAVLAATGRQGAIPSAIVDGLEVATAARPANADTDLGRRLAAISKAAPPPERDALTATFGSCEADFDAVADLLMANGVMALVQGNVDAASASTAVVGSNTGGIPDPTITAIRTDEHLVTHRVIAAFSASRPAPPNPQGSAIVGAGWADLDAWLASMLPPFGDRRIRIEWFEDGRAIRDAEVSLGQLGVTAAHLVAWSSPAVEVERSELVQYAIAMAAPEGIDPRAGEGSVRVDISSVEEVVVAAGALADAVGISRPLRDADLVDPSGSEAPPVTVDLAELGARATSVAAALRSAAAHLGVGARPSSAIEAAWCDLPGVLAWLRGDRTVEDVRARLHGRADALDAADRSDPAALIDGLAAAGGKRFPVLPRLVVGDPSGLAASVGTDSTRLRGRAEGWMTATAQVHAGVDAVHQALLLADTVGAPAGLAPTLLQLPRGVADDGWAALDLPDFEAARSRLSILSVSDLARAARSGAIAGLVFDAWTEAIPGTQTTTGVAVNFDSPSSRAPQAIVLATPPRGRKWNMNVMVELLHQLIQATKNRAVGPETLQFHGHLLPAVFVSDKAKLLTEDAVGAAERERV